MGVGEVGRRVESEVGVIRSVSSSEHTIGNHVFQLQAREKSTPKLDVHWGCRCPLPGRHWVAFAMEIEMAGFIFDSLPPNLGYAQCDRPVSRLVYSAKVFRAPTGLKERFRLHWS